MRLGKLLHEVMGWPGPMTGRQYFWWLRHLERPTDDQRYSMQIAMKIMQSGAPSGTLLTWDSLDLSKVRPQEKFDHEKYLQERGGVVNYKGVMMSWAEYLEAKERDGAD